MNREEDKALMVPLDQAGISIDVGKDGVWICLKSSSRKSMCFQPIQLFNNNGIIDSAVKGWCVDMQKMYDDSIIISQTNKPKSEEQEDE